MARGKKKGTSNANVGVPRRDLRRTGRFTCLFCNKICKTYGELVTHTPKHTKEKPIKCNECDATFSFLAAKYVHRNSVHWGRTYDCDECSKTFAAYSNLLGHKRQVHGHRAKAVGRPECKRRWGKKTGVQAEVKKKQSARKISRRKIKVEVQRKTVKKAIVQRNTRSKARMEVVEEEPAQGSSQPDQDTSEELTDTTENELSFDKMEPELKLEPEVEDIDSKELVTIVTLDGDDSGDIEQIPGKDQQETIVIPEVHEEEMDTASIKVKDDSEEELVSEPPEQEEFPENPNVSGATESLPKPETQEYEDPIAKIIASLDFNPPPAITRPSVPTEKEKPPKNPKLYAPKPDYPEMVLVDPVTNAVTPFISTPNCETNGPAHPPNLFFRVNGQIAMPVFDLPFLYQMARRNRKRELMAESLQWNHKYNQEHLATEKVAKTVKPKLHKKLGAKAKPDVIPKKSHTFKHLKNKPSNKECYLSKPLTLENSTVMPYSCGKCGARFRFKCHWSRHIKFHETQRYKTQLQETPMDCQFCGSRYFLKASLIRHIISQHLRRPSDTNSTVVYCPACDFQGDTSMPDKGLYKHISGHLQQNSELFEAAKKITSTVKTEEPEKEIVKHANSKPHLPRPGDNQSEIVEAPVKNTTSPEETGDPEEEVVKNVEFKPEPNLNAKKVVKIKKSRKIRHPTPAPKRKPQLKRLQQKAKNLSPNPKPKQPVLEKINLPVTSSNLQSHSCEKCGASFRLKCNLANHLKFQHGLEKKEQQGTATAHLACQLCGSKYLAKASLIRHMIACHCRRSLTKRTVVYCPVPLCNFRGNTSLQDKGLYMHLVGHLQQNPELCKASSRINASPATQRHSVKPSPKSEPQKLFEPSTAKPKPAQVPKQKHLKRKVKIVQAKAKKPLPGFIPGLYRSALLNPNSKPHSCAKCGASFRLRCHLATHLKHHESFLKRKEEPTQCQFCGCSYSLKLSLMRHIMAYHLREPDPNDKSVKQCPFCSYQGSSSAPEKYWYAHLREHLIRKSETIAETAAKIVKQGLTFAVKPTEKEAGGTAGDKPHFQLKPKPVSKNGNKNMAKIFATKPPDKKSTGRPQVQLKKRKPKPTGKMGDKKLAKKLATKPSGKKPAGKPRLQVKNRKPATKSGSKKLAKNIVARKPFPCKHCGMAFKFPCVLKRHITTHTGEKPFPCPMCDMCVTRKFTMIDHLILKHCRKSSQDATSGSSEKIFGCCLCPDSKDVLYSKISLKQHLMQNHNNSFQMSSP